MKMRMENLWRMLFLFFFAIHLLACDNDKENARQQAQPVYPLVFDKDSCIIRKGIATQLYAVTCNGYNALDFKVGDTSLLEAKCYIMENGTSHASGWISLVGRKKGHTSLEVFDRIVQDNVVLDIRITDSYLGMQIQETNHSLFLNMNVGFLFLIDNEQKEFYLFSREGQEPGEVVLKGTYFFMVENKVPYLTLVIGNEENQTLSYKFDLSGNKSNVYTILNFWFHLGWEEKVDKQTRALDNTLYLHMKEAGTAEEVIFAVTDPPLPVGILLPY